MKFGEIISKERYCNIIYGDNVAVEHITFTLDNSKFNINDVIEYSIGHYMQRDELEVFTYYNGNVKEFKSSMLEFECIIKPIFTLKNEDGKVITGNTISLPSTKLTIDTIGFLLLNNESEELKSSDEIKIFNGCEYRRKSTYANIGDLILFPKVKSEWENFLTANKLYEVIGEEVDKDYFEIYQSCVYYFKGDNGQDVNVYGDTEGYDTVNDVIVYEKIQK